MNPRTTTTHSKTAANVQSAGNASAEGGAAAICAAPRGSPLRRNNAGRVVDDDAERLRGLANEPEGNENRKDNKQPVSPALSRASTEIIESEPEPEPPVFETNVRGAVIARDFAHADKPLTPPVSTFSIIPAYVWFLYMRKRISLKKFNIELNFWTSSAFAPRDLVLLVHFNWITVEDCFWLDARSSLGDGLIALRDRPTPFNFDLQLGTTYLAEDAPIVKKYFKRFDACEYFEKYIVKLDGGVYDQLSDDQDRKVFGRLGSTIYNEFTDEHSQLEAMYEHLCGRGPMPECSEKMKRTFAPILHCRGGGVGGRGTPYERPCAKRTQPAEGTEPEEVKIDAKSIALEKGQCMAYLLLSWQLERDRRHKARAGSSKENVNRPRTRAAVKAAEAAAAAAALQEKGEMYAIELAPPPVPTGQRTRAAALRKAGITATKGAAAAAPKRKGKEKAVHPTPLLDSSTVATGSKRPRDREEDDADVADPSTSLDALGPGPSRRTRRKAAAAEPPTAATAVASTATLRRQRARKAVISESAVLEAAAPDPVQAKTTKAMRPVRERKRSREEQDEGDALPKKRVRTPAAKAVATTSRVKVEQPEQPAETSNTGGRPRRACRAGR